MKMNKALSITILLLPTLALLSGLATAPAILAFSILLLSQHKYAVLDTMRSHYKRIEMGLILWCFISSIWSVNPLYSLKQTIILYLLFLMARAILASTTEIQKTFSDKLLGYLLILSLLVAAIIFCIEYYYGGIITTSGRDLLNPNKAPHQFYLYMMDRGCSVLALTGWITIGWLLRNDHRNFACLIAVMLLYILYLSDSLAAFVGFLLGIITFFAMYFSRLRLLPLMILGLLSYSVLMPTIFYAEDPLALNNTYSNLPTSAKHRIFIWSFATNKAMESPVVGHGVNSSKFIASKDDFVIYDNIKLGLLPLHPHNNIIQLLLELGGIGLVIFLSIITKYLIDIKHLALSYGDTSWGAVAYACFVTYFFIAMVSFNMWQTWWCTIAIFCIFMLKLSLRKTINTTSL